MLGLRTVVGRLHMEDRGESGYVGEHVVHSIQCVEIRELQYMPCLVM